MPFGFAFADPRRNALAAAALLVAFIGTGSSFLAFAAVAGQRGLKAPEFPTKGLYYLGGLTEGAETIAVFVAMCLWPAAFAALAWVFAALCLITTLMRWRGAGKHLRRSRTSPNPNQKGNRMRSLFCAAGLACALAAASSAAHADAAWDAVLAKAKGETVYWNAWGGDERTNGFIAWAGEQLRSRYGVEVRQVKLTDTGEAVARVVAEKSAGRDADGAVDLIWINGPEFPIDEAEGPALRAVRRQDAERGK